ncbi:transcriptional regulator, partial [Nostoc sp. 3335mG]
PGAYLKARRTAARLSVADVAGVLATDPRIAWHERATWISRIEADIAPASWTTIVALRQLFAFDLDVLERLSLIHVGHTLPAPLLCEICGDAAVVLSHQTCAARCGSCLEAA